jgi:hypothetical protein
MQVDCGTLEYELHGGVRSRQLIHVILDLSKKIEHEKAATTANLKFLVKMKHHKRLNICVLLVYDTFRTNSFSPKPGFRVLPFGGR